MAALGSMAWATYTEREAWAADHAEVLIATAEWWLAANAPGVLERPGSAPSEVIEALRALRPEVWAAQARAVVNAEEAAACDDPGLRALAAALAAGELVDPRALGRLRVPVDGRQAQAEALGDHDARRTAAVQAALAALPVWRRRATRPADLAAAYDDEHLLACEACGVARPRRKGPVEPCPLCGGRLRGWAERSHVPRIEDSLAAVARQLGRVAAPASGGGR